MLRTFVGFFIFLLSLVGWFLIDVSKDNSTPSAILIAAGMISGAILLSCFQEKN